MIKDFKEGVGTLITNKNDEVLLMQRGPGSKNNHGKWENVGGHVESDESPRDTIIREAYEELGITITVGKVLIKRLLENNGKVYLDYFFESTTNDNPKIMESEKCSAIAWVKKSELKNYDLCDYTEFDFKELGYL